MTDPLPTAEKDARPDLDTETVDYILTELEDWGNALLAEHERRVCDTHGPVVPSKNTGQSLVQYAARLRNAIEREAVDKSLHGETPWDEAVQRARPGFDFRGRPIPPEGGRGRG